MVNGLTKSQEIIEIKLNSFMLDSIKDSLEKELSTKPEHRIVSIATVAGGDEFNGAIRVVAVIEYV